MAAATHAGEQKSMRGVIYLHVGWSSLPTLLRYSVSRRRSWYLRSELTSGRGQALLRFFKVRAIDLAAEPALCIPEGSTEGPMRRAIAALDAQGLDRAIDLFAERYPLAPNARGILRSAVLRAVAGRSLDAFYAELWSQTKGLTSVRFVGVSPWDSLLLTDRGKEMKVVGAVSRACGRLSKLSTVARSQKSNAPQPEVLGRTAKGLLGETDVWRKNFEFTQELLFILNEGTSYGGLYAYDHVLSQDPDSPLHPSRIRVIARSGGTANTEGIRQSWPGSGSRRAQLLTTLRLASRGLAPAKSASFATTWFLARFSAAVDGTRAVIAQEHAGVRVALLAYDIQIPIALVLGLESMGVRTVALNERPLSVVVDSQPFALSRLLAASPYFAHAAVQSTSVNVTKAVAVGMWRTDLIHRYRAEAPHELAVQARARGQRFVVALPYHHQETANFGTNPLATAVFAVRHFLGDIVTLAKDRPDLFIVIRGKNASWLTDADFADLARGISELSNVEVSLEYERLNESYRLVAAADVVLAKYTSLVDEALAMGIPCVVHDYLPNAAGVARGVVSYLPEQIWALNHSAFLARLDSALKSEGRIFREEFEPERQRIFADLADGHVAERAQAQIIGMLRPA